MLRLERAYDKTGAPRQRKRFLVERLWPRGIRKDDLRIDGWLKEVAPSTKPSAWGALVDTARHGDVTLIFSSHDPERNNAVALREYLGRQLKRPRKPGAVQAGARKRAA